MSGTRMNSKIEDLAQSITVMTKEQMPDGSREEFEFLAVADGFHRICII